jgi:hypothetical protein
MKRLVQSELLDELLADDPRAVHSRQDLRRINAWMGNTRIMGCALRQTFLDFKPARITEIGAGDGEFLLKVAGHFGARSIAPRRVLLVDLQNLLQSETRKRFEDLNWNVEARQSDVFAFFANGAENTDAVIANLFLHHFSETQLRELFNSVANKTRVLIAVEPRRSPLAFFFSKLLWLIGCNSVTRHDAPVSVRAGFRDGELSALWPDKQNWELTERRTGLFSHVFIAQRKGQHGYA